MSNKPHHRKPTYDATAEGVPVVETRTHVPEHIPKVVLMPEAAELLEEGKNDNQEDDGYSPTSPRKVELIESSTMGSAETNKAWCHKTVYVHPLMILVQFLFSGNINESHPPQVLIHQCFSPRVNEQSARTIKSYIATADQSHSLPP